MADTTAQGLNNLGGLMQAMGDYATTRIYYEQAVSIAEEKVGKDHPTTKIFRDNLASLPISD